MLLPLFYFAPISYFSVLVNNKTEEYLFETQENFEKQTYRNRCYIYGANGKLALSVPVQHQNISRKYKDTKISYDFNWKKQHIKSLESAYRSSPFFEYYEDSLQEIFDQNETFLLDLNLKILTWILEKLQIKTEIGLTSNYTISTNDTSDFRHQFGAKTQTAFELTHSETLPNYIQVFGESHGFIRNLSILDLLFNCGPNSKEKLTTNL